MEFEDILLEVGDSGRYQKELILVFLIPTAVLLPWYTVNIMFMVSVPEHWCYVPEVAHSNLTFEQQRSLISPINDTKCRMYDINYTEYMSSGMYAVPNDTKTKYCDLGWDFDKTYYDATAATQWNMYCKDDHYTSLILTLFNVGSIIGTPIYGWLADKIGRRITFYIVLLVTVVTAFASVMVRDFTAFAVIKAINGSLMPCLFQIPYIIILELVAPEMRTHMNGLVNCAWTVGLSILPLVAYLTRSWITLGFITSAVILVYFLYWPYLPESPRWLVSQEKYDEAAKILMKVAAKNGELADVKELTVHLKILGEKMKKEKVELGEASTMDLLKYPKLRKTFFIISWCWVADVMAYYGLQINVQNLAGNEFINFFLTSIVEIPGYLAAWVLMDKLGRRWPCVVGFLLTGIVCMLPAVVTGLPHADIACSMLGKFFASFTFMATYQQSSELYPTVLRSLGMGMSSTVSMTVSIATPYIIYLAVYGKAIPFVIIGLVSITGGIAASFLPETLNENLPQTISDTENFGKRQKYFSWNRRRRSMCRERAASLALQLKGLEALGIKDSDGKLKNSSKALQNSDFRPEKKKSLGSNKVEDISYGKNNFEVTANINHEHRDKTPDRNSINKEKSDPSYQRNKESEMSKNIDSESEPPKYAFVNSSYDDSKDSDNRRITTVDI